jgi:hypothetical protein
VGKVLAIGLAVLVQLAGLAGAHFYFSANPRDVLIVVDSSYGLSGYQTKIETWIDQYLASSRYERIVYATDKTYLGTGDSNRDRLYRVSFGSLNTDTLNQNYSSNDYDVRLLLTFNDIDVSGWQIVHFQP